MKVIAVLQARLGSTRLPAKALLPICGFPMAILAAKRAQRNGLQVIIATSTSSLDDILAHIAQEVGITVVRGSIDDVLGRFVQATANLPEDAIVVRLTSDNVFPDADFINIALEQFLMKKNIQLLATTEESNLPYGLSIEVFRCGVLREAAKKALTPYQREHVTPWIRSTYGVHSLMIPSLPKEWGALRCTVDTLEDYECVWKVFKACKENPVSVSWRTLCNVLARRFKDVCT
ncbi:MAG: hypothetical protein QXT45_07620 [Candidatus Bilamarchaeaceae archaeon]